MEEHRVIVQVREYNWMGYRTEWKTIHLPSRLDPAMVEGKKLSKVYRHVRVVTPMVKRQNAVRIYHWRWMDGVGWAGRLPPSGGVK